MSVRKIPFQMRITLAFRMAWMAYQQGGEASVFQIKYQDIRKTVKEKDGEDGWKRECQYYWDWLYDTNVRGKSWDAWTKEEDKDPDKEAWIKSLVEKGYVKTEQTFFDMKGKP